MPTDGWGYYDEILFNMVIPESDLQDPVTAAEYLTSTYVDIEWNRS